MNSRQILIIDDNPTNLKLAASVLKFEGYEVLAAENAFAAIDILVAAKPDLILMDLAMPGMDGLTLTRKLKGDPTTRELRIVALTASAMKGDDKRAIEAGCEAYITKPIDTRKLPEQIAEILGVGKGAAQ